MWTRCLWGSWEWCSSGIELTVGTTLAPSHLFIITTSHCFLQLFLPSQNGNSSASKLTHILTSPSLQRKYRRSSLVSRLHHSLQPQCSVVVLSDYIMSPPIPDQDIATLLREFLDSEATGPPVNDPPLMLATPSCQDDPLDVEAIVEPDLP